MSGFALCLVVLWVLFLCCVLVFNNPFTHQEVKEAEKNEGQNWPEE